MPCHRESRLREGEAGLMSEESTHELLRSYRPAKTEGETCGKYVKVASHSGAAVTVL
jgi:hypothetical protein